MGFSAWELLDASQSIHASDDAVDARVEMIDIVFGDPLPTRLPDDVRLHTDPAFHGYLIQKVIVDADDLSSIAYLIHPGSWNGALAIYHQGHRGDFRELGADTILGLLEADYQVLAFSMPMRGMNTHQTPTRL
jgi:hypothetical protein